jgi:hypothetical protein
MTPRPAIANAASKLAPLAVREKRLRVEICRSSPINRQKVAASSFARPD